MPSHIVLPFLILGVDYISAKPASLKEVEFSTVDWLHCVTQKADLSHSIVLPASGWGPLLRYIIMDGTMVDGQLRKKIR